MSLVVEIEKQLGDFTLRADFSTDDLVTGLLGASGCGKSLTLRCIAGVLRPDRGRILLDGEPLYDSARGIDLPPQARQVGYLFQSYALFPNMTVEQNILCGLRARTPKPQRRAALEEMMERMQLRGLEKLRPAQLSGGQAQRVALARILVSQPRLLLLDEPFSALDSHLRDQLQPQLLELLRSVGRQTLLVTHSRDEAYHLCSRLCVMERGQILCTGPTKTVFADPEWEAAARLTGCKNIAPAQKTGEFSVFVPSWGVQLTTAKPVPDDLRSIGLRAHYFHPRSPQNRFAVNWVSALEEPFEWILLFRYVGQDPDSPPIWWRLPKDRKPSPLPETLGIAPENILLLR